MKRSPLKRTKPLLARKPRVQKRPGSHWPVRRRRKTLEQFGDREFRRWIHSLPCIVSRRVGDGIQQAHVVSRARGGTWKDTVPMWVVVHREYHDIGHKRFEEKYGVDLRKEADNIYRRWQDILAETRR